MKLTDSEKGVLLMGAREAIQSMFIDLIPTTIDYVFYPHLKEKMGAFVTLIKDNALRGCIGYLQSDMTLYETVCESAKHAAFNDPRFQAVTNEEIPKLFLEISVLSPMMSISDLEEIEIGVHGLSLDHEGYRAVLLPQVAVENNYNIPQFLNALCEKAGLPPFTWQDTYLNIKVFTADIFSELGKRRRTYEYI